MDQTSVARHGARKCQWRCTGNDGGRRGRRTDGYCARLEDAKGLDDDECEPVRVFPCALRLRQLLAT